MLDFQEMLVLGFILVIVVAVVANLGSRAHGRHRMRRRAQPEDRDSTRMRRRHS